MRHRHLFGPGNPFTVFTVVNDYSGHDYSMLYAMTEGRLTGDEAEKLEAEEFDEAMRSIRPIFQEADVPVKEVCLHGNPSEQISEFAKSQQFDLLIMGSGSPPRRAALTGFLILTKKTGATLKAAPLCCRSAEESLRRESFRSVLHMHVIVTLHVSRGGPHRHGGSGGRGGD